MLCIDRDDEDTGPIVINCAGRRDGRSAIDGGKLVLTNSILIALKIYVTKVTTSIHFLIVDRYMCKQEKQC